MKQLTERDDRHNLPHNEHNGASWREADVLAELAKFFAIAVDSPRACPMFSTVVDQAWHALLSRPDSYARFSREACGTVLGHQLGLGEGQIHWVPDYEARFGKLPALWFADATGTVDQTAYATYCTTGEVFHSWDCTRLATRTTTRSTVDACHTNPGRRLTATPLTGC